MGKRDPFFIGKQSFNSRAEAGRVVSRLLQSATVDEPLSGADLTLAHECFLMHPAALEKAPDGATGHRVKSIVYRPGIVQRCFFAITGAGEIDWSYRVALGFVPCGPTVQEAARDLISADMAAFKASRFGSADSVPCAATGDQVSFADAHVDHAGQWSFAAILREFIRERGVPEVVAVEPWGSVFTSEDDARSFKDFHDARASLRIIHKKINMSLGARGGS